MARGASPPRKTIGRHALGSVPEGTQGERDLLEERLALYGRWGALISLTFYVAVNALVQLTPRGTIANLWRSPVNRWHLASTALLAGMWLATRGRPKSRAFLASVDAGAVVGVGVCFAFMGTTSYWSGDPTLPLVLAITNTLGFRAFVIPSSAPRTACIHTLASLPVAVAAFFIHRALVPTFLAALWDTLYTVLWLAVSVVVTTLTSRVIYGLTERVRESRRLGQYTLEAEIGSGGMGTVYRARHAMLRRATAIKLLHPERSSEEDVKRFEREVRMTSRLTHPNTVAVYDYGRTPDGLFYYAMELLDGTDLQELVGRHGPMPPARVVHLLRQIAGALGEAHEIGLIHRDVKPANVIVCERGRLLDVAKVVDFGLVKALDAGDGGVLAATNAITGTPLYMPPEAVQAPDTVDARSDLYALGAVAYFLLTGEPPFRGENIVTVLASHIHETPRPPSEVLGAPIPPDLEALVLRCLEKAQRARPASADVFAAELARIAEALPWTQDDARAWWSAHRAAPHSVVRPRGAEPVSPVTVTVAMAGR